MHSLNNPAQIRLWNTIRRGYRFQSTMERTLQRLNLSSDRRKKLLALTGIRGHCSGLPASDIEARIRSMEILYQATDDYAGSEMAPDDEILLGTFTCDTGLTYDYAPHLRLKTFIGKTYAADAAIGMMAIDAAVNAIAAWRIRCMACPPDWVGCRSINHRTAPKGPPSRLGSASNRHGPEEKPSRQAKCRRRYLPRKKRSGSRCGSNCARTTRPMRMK